MACLWDEDPQNDWDYMGQQVNQVEEIQNHREGQDHTILQESNQREEGM
jgi:hypothetical protein